MHSVISQISLILRQDGFSTDSMGYFCSIVGAEMEFNSLVILVENDTDRTDTYRIVLSAHPHYGYSIAADYTWAAYSALAYARGVTPVSRFDSEYFDEDEEEELYYRQAYQLLVSEIEQL